MTHFRHGCRFPDGPQLFVLTNHQDWQKMSALEKNGLAPQAGMPIQYGERSHWYAIPTDHSDRNF